MVVVKILKFQFSLTQQKFALGDDSGALQCYKIRKGECTEVFKTEANKSPICCVAHAGLKQKKDKVFYVLLSLVCLLLV